MVERTGDWSYRVEVKDSVIQDVHHDHLKEVVDSLVTEPLYELHHFQGVYQDYNTAPDEYIVDKVLEKGWNP